MGIEFYQYLQSIYGPNQLLAMLESENGCVDTSSVDYDNNGQLSNDFQQMGFEANEPEQMPQTPHKERVLFADILLFLLFAFLFICHIAFNLLIV